jgi:hypothetical protein
MKSIEFLEAAIAIQAERGAEYNKAQGERSAQAVATAFNAITGKDLTESEVWLLLQVLKDVRQWADPTRYHHDSAVDSVAYCSLKAEALHRAGVPQPVVCTAPARRPLPENWRTGDVIKYLGPALGPFVQGSTYYVDRHIGRDLQVRAPGQIGVWALDRVLENWEWVERP